MGRIKTTLVKRTGSKLFKENEDKFSNDFAENKLAVDELAEIQSKKLRNVIAGYVTRLNKNKKEL
ncbi:30S ribosomal protein S17e [Candidatus Woesearchaeota archaeon]|jgi:small subunit ribosomal protein S17e|nr:30S ribosomal protein S17e [Candidatus Woesearchaeota archaeon]